MLGLSIRHALILCGITSLFPLSSINLLAQESGMLIMLDKSGKIEVLPVDQQKLPVQGEYGVYLWSEGTREKVTELTSGGITSAAMTFGLGGNTRGLNGSNESGSLSLNLPLDQVLSRMVARGEGFMTPTDKSLVLNPRLTIRRIATAGTTKFPASTLQVKSSTGNVLFSFTIAEGQDKLAWNDIKGVPAEYQAGLPAGEYVIANKDKTSESTSFTILGDDREFATWWMNKLNEVTTDDDRILRVTFGLFQLMSYKNSDGKLQPLSSDALDLVESIPEDQQTPFLKQQAHWLRSWLSGQKVTESTAGISDPTGIKEIDQARQLIADGRWTEAGDLLKTASNTSDTRVQGLATLYQAVLLSESAPTQEMETDALFVDAIATLGDAPTIDQFRASFNYANFLSSRVQDRIYNFSFQSAAGVSAPYMTTLMSLNQALSQYDVAAEHASHLNPALKSAVIISRAQLYQMLSDLLLTLSANDEQSEGFRKLRAGIAKLVISSVEPIVSAKNTPLDLQATAASILAHIAYRDGKLEECEKQLAIAQHDQLQLGSLIGIESVYRLKGMVNQRRIDDRKPDLKLVKAATQDLKISQVISESLREQIPMDDAGSSRTGFFSRRAYVNERLMELYLMQGLTREALELVEEAKARALQDVLVIRKIHTTTESFDNRNLDDILANWPEKTACLEYFLSSDKAWLFVITPGKEPQHFQLKYPNGQPITSTELITHVHRVLTIMEGQSQKMLKRMMAGKGFDNSWQNDLHALWKILVPKEIVAELRSNETVVISPHHILHYFPFTALVTVPDVKATKSSIMAKPSFMIEEPYALIMSPSLSVWDLQQQQPQAKMTNAWGLGIVEVPGAPALPGVKKDLDNYRAVFGGNVRGIMEENNARESKALDLLNQPGLLLISTHGMNQPDAPLDSFLLLLPEDQPATDDATASATKGDGRLSAREIYENKVQSELVVMSACYSGLGDRSPLPGDDLFGLQRALLHSGTKTIVSGLWDVFDGTAPILMHNFFTRISKEEESASALANAQRDFLKQWRATGKQEPFLHPYFWAVFTITGDQRTTFQK
jgi:CHAT domain-containing protein